LAETGASQKGKGEAALLQFAAPGSTSTPSKAPAIVCFDRAELAMLLNVYGRKVAAGEWRDYAMDMLRDRALFSIYQRSSERAHITIEKNPKLRNKQGQYIVTNAQGRVLRRGHELDKVLRVLEPSFAVIK
jgi:hypothetical protein